MCENRNLGCYGWQIKFAEKLTEKNLGTSETSVILYLQDIEAKVYPWSDQILNIKWNVWLRDNFIPKDYYAQICL